MQNKDLRGNLIELFFSVPVLWKRNEAFRTLSFEQATASKIRQIHNDAPVICTALELTLSMV
jgi:hypothetical protein